MEEQDFPKIRVESNGKRSIFDVLRQRFVALTPEAEVRQQFIHYLITEKHYPRNLLANEVSIELNGTKKRCDSVLYDIHMKPRMIIEYKAKSVKISQKVFDQILRYNVVSHVDYLIVTNLTSTFVCKITDQHTATFLENIPEYDTL